MVLDLWRSSVGQLPVHRIRPPGHDPAADRAAEREPRAWTPCCEGIALGACSFLPKPVNFTALVATCRAALSRPPLDACWRARERRAHPRHAFVVPVRMAREESDRRAYDVDTARGFARGELVDLSAGGARVVAGAACRWARACSCCPTPT
jgi:hypothetical protein